MTKNTIETGEKLNAPLEPFTCICRSVKNPANRVEVKKGNETHVYHKNCPYHGIFVMSDDPMVQFRNSKWFTKKQLPLITLEDPKLLEVSKDDSRGLIEFTDYRVMTEEERNEYNREAAQSDQEHD